MLLTVALLNVLLSSLNGYVVPNYLYFHTGGSFVSQRSSLKTTMFSSYYSAGNKYVSPVLLWSQRTTSRQPSNPLDHFTSLIYGAIINIPFENNNQHKKPRSKKIVPVYTKSAYSPAPKHPAHSQSHSQSQSHSHSHSH
jgi:hypothetical protein